MDIKGTSSTDCYGPIFFYPYDVLKLMGADGFFCYIIMVVFLFFLMIIQT